MKKQAVLAFSGGLDTSYCVKYLLERDLEVHTVCVNSGGFDEGEIARISGRAKMLGSSRHIVLDITPSFYDDCIRFLVYGNVLRHHTYPLSVSAERVFQAIAVADYAKRIGADFLAHGSTGAGNDQVRFDMIFQVRAPGIDILTPIRDQNISREEEIAYLRSKGVDLDWKQVAYSINRGIWGTSVGGKETLTSHRSLPDEAYPTLVSKQEPLELALRFEKGEIRALNGDTYAHPVEAVRALENLASGYGIGRGIHVGDTIIGIKGRVGFEAAAPLMLIKAHETLEKHVLTKWQIYWKEQLSNWYGMLLHEGQFLDPVMRDIEVYLEHAQRTVTGEVYLKLYPNRFEVLGISSDYDLMQSGFGTYGESFAGWKGEDVRGFAKILSVPVAIYESVNKKHEET